MRNLILSALVIMGSFSAVAADPQVRIETLTPQPAVVKVGKVSANDLGTAIPSALDSVEKALKALKAEAVGPAFTRTISPSASAYHFEAGFAVTKEYKNLVGFKSIMLPGGEVATLTYVGPYDENYKGYQIIDAWMKKNNKKLNGKTWELYLDDPKTTPPAKQRTQIYYPL